MNRKIALKLLDNYKRKYFLKNELKNKLNCFYKIKYTNKINQEYFFFKKKNTSNVYRITKLNNKCIKSGRSYNISNKTKLSRFELRSNLKKNMYSSFFKK